ncbi:hypothetical protein FH972_019816 [Carpinus fangiana]|uniref:Uncharacterized protein n=1 Tax=Carpinus fangiana TaxID=176857 RepID=A0A5N6RSU4_9ROSI|nr:hypothetical protein FH972_019816 [Carpinus fangiana]
MKALAQKLLGLISESLGLRSPCIEEAVGELHQNITFSYYPPCPQPEPHPRSPTPFRYGGHHAFDPRPRRRPSTSQEQPLAHRTPFYKSAQHRAITNATQARLAVATFHDPAKAVKISPVSELVSESSPQYLEVLYGDYVSSWYTKGLDG